MSLNRNNDDDDDARRPFFIQSSKNRIIEVDIIKNVARFVISSGIENEVVCGSAVNMDMYEFAPMVKFVAQEATIGWIKHEKLWLKLQGVTLINFHGRHDQAFLQYLVSRLSNVATISFTYFSTANFAKIINHISSSSVVEITAHVNGTKSAGLEVYDAISKRTDWKLERLLLVLNESLLGDIIDEIDQKISNALAVNSEVYLLYAFEYRIFCMMKLLDMGYKSYGYFEFAANNSKSACSYPEMPFEHYWLFKKESPVGINSTNYIVGFKKGLPNMFVINHGNYQDENVQVPHINYQWKNVYEERTVAPYLPDAEAYSLTSPDQEYRNLQYENEVKKGCCNPIYYPTMSMPWGAPIWKNTRIQQVIYHARNTFILFTNGLLFSLRYMSMENDFFESMSQRVMPRLIISVTNFARRRINSGKFVEFLSGVRHLELKGNIWSGLNMEIFKHLSKSVISISMMRVCLDRNVLNKLNLYLSEEVRQNLKHYYFDGRDTPETSFASTFNGFSNSVFKIQHLQEVLIIANQLSNTDLQYRTTIKSVCKDLLSVTDENASITVALLERGHILELKKLGFQERGEVLIPRIFGQRFNDNDFEISVNCFWHNLRGRSFTFIVPFE